MAETFESPSVRYITEENGERVGVILSWDEYQKLSNAFTDDPDLLPGLSVDELEVLAQGMLTSEKQARLHDLLQRNQDNDLGEKEKREFEILLEHVDSMNLIKARAQYTLQHVKRRAHE